MVFASADYNQRKQPTPSWFFKNLYLPSVSLWLQTWSSFNRLARKIEDTTWEISQFLVVYSPYFFAVQLCISHKLFSLKCPFSHMKNVAVGVGLLPLLHVLPGSKRIYTDKYVEPTSVENESGLLGHVLWYPKVTLLHCLFHMKLKSALMWNECVGTVTWPNLYMNCGGIQGLWEIVWLQERILVYVENVTVLSIEGYIVFLGIFVHSCLITLGEKKSLFGELEQVKKGSLYVLGKCFWIVDGISTSCQN